MSERKAKPLGGKARRLFWPLAAGGLALILAVAVVSELVSPPSAPARAASRLAVGGDLAAAEREALRALKSSPIDASALSALGLVADRKGDTVRARALMTAANALSRRDSVSIRWLINDRLANRDHAGALALMDAALRRDPQEGAAFYTTLAFASSDPAARRAIVATLRTAPPWRRNFIERLATWQDPAITREVMVGLKTGPTPPDTLEASYYVARLYRQTRYAEARAAAFEFGPQRGDRRAVVFDGGFDGGGGVPPFTWVVGQDSGVIAAIEAWPGKPGDKALHLQHDGFSRMGFASQTIASPPGDQILSADIVATPADMAGDIHWVVTCAENHQVILDTPLKGGAERSRFTAPFTVPDTECTAQFLQLRSEPGDRRTYVDAWLDNVVIKPAGGA